MSGGMSQALNNAANKAVDPGMHFAVAAGNDDKDVYSYSPASAEKVITVCASTLGDDLL